MSFTGGQFPRPTCRSLTEALPTTRLERKVATVGGAVRGGTGCLQLLPSWLSASFNGQQRLVYLACD